VFLISIDLNTDPELDLGSDLDSDLGFFKTNENKNFAVEIVFILLSHELP